MQHPGHLQGSRTWSAKRPTGNRSPAHRLHRRPPVDDATHPREVPRSNLLTDPGSRIAPKFGIFFGRVSQGPGLEASRALCLSSAQLRHPDIIYQDRCSRALCWVDYIHSTLRPARTVDCVHHRLPLASSSSSCLYMEHRARYPYMYSYE